MRQLIWLPSGCRLASRTVRTCSVCWPDRDICLHRLRSSTSGVCNTDNFSLLSITIDYGPFGFMESYNPGAYSGVCGCVIKITERPVAVRCQTEAVTLQILSRTHPMMRADTGLELRPTSGCSTWRGSWLLSFLCFLKNSRKSKKDVQLLLTSICSNTDTAPFGAYFLKTIGWKQRAPYFSVSVLKLFSSFSSLGPKFFWKDMVIFTRWGELQVSPLHPNIAPAVIMLYLVLISFSGTVLLLLVVTS